MGVVGAYLGAAHKSTCQSNQLALPKTQIASILGDGCFQTLEHNRVSSLLF